MDSWPVHMVMNCICLEVVGALLETEYICICKIIGPQAAGLQESH